LYDGNNYASLPIGHSVHLKESYENLELVLTKIGYTAHVDLWKSEGVVRASRSAGWLYQVPMFHVCMGQQSKKLTLVAKTLDTKDIS
jgi:hypothetical protein